MWQNLGLNPELRGCGQLERAGLRPGERKKQALDLVEFLTNLTAVGWIGAGPGVFLLNNLSGRTAFRKVVNLKSGSEPGVIGFQATPLKVSNCKDGARFGRFQQLSFDLVPADPTRTVEP